jgi:hypothetical protein
MRIGSNRVGMLSVKSVELLMGYRQFDAGRT